LAPIVVFFIRIAVLVVVVVVILLTRVVVLVLARIHVVVLIVIAFLVLVLILVRSRSRSSDRALTVTFDIAVAAQVDLAACDQCPVNGGLAAQMRLAVERENVAVDAALARKVQVLAVSFLGTAVMAFFVPAHVNEDFPRLGAAVSMDRARARELHFSKDV